MADHAFLSIVIDFLKTWADFLPDFNFFNSDFNLTFSSSVFNFSFSNLAFSNSDSFPGYVWVSSSSSDLFTFFDFVIVFSQSFT